MLSSIFYNVSVKFFIQKVLLLDQRVELFINIPTEPKLCRFLELMNLVLRARLSDLFLNQFRIIRFLISPPSHLRWGKAGMGVDVVDLSPPP